LESLGNFIENAHGGSPVSIEFYRGVQATPPQPGFHNTVHDAIPETLPDLGQRLWNDTASFCFCGLRSKKRLS
jgi:hypothetical protein